MKCAAHVLRSTTLGRVLLFVQRLGSTASPKLIKGSKPLERAACKPLHHGATEQLLSKRLGIAPKLSRIARDQNACSLAQAVRECCRFDEFDEHLAASRQREEEKIHAPAACAGPGRRKQRHDSEPCAKYLRRVFYASDE
jgi:hypothetical protein